MGMGQVFTGRIRWSASDATFSEGSPRSARIFRFRQTRTRKSILGRCSMQTSAINRERGDGVGAIGAPKIETGFHRRQKLFRFFD
jgi:hypothetical protein